jgi:tetratricopeptide (TPR) repeat protein
MKNAPGATPAEVEGNSRSIGCIKIRKDLPAHFPVGHRGGQAMLVARNIVGRGLLLIFAALLLSFIVAGSAASEMKKTYSPKLPMGIGSLDEARKDLGAVLANRGKTFLIIYFDTKYTFPNKKAVQDLEKTMEKMAWTNIYHGAQSLALQTIRTYSLPVYDDRIDIPVFPVFFEDLEGFRVMVVDDIFVNLPGKVQLRMDNAADAQRIADDLLFIQQNWQKYEAEEEKAFKEKAVQYRTMKAKPPITEEQRKLVVQGDALNNRKNYAGAIERYKKAIKMDPTAYPVAYSNLALLSAQLERYGSAIRYMKRYLLLEPQAKDARTAQDKIYEWEMLMEK